MFEKQKTFFRGLNKLIGNPSVLDEQAKNIRNLEHALQTAHDKVTRNFNSVKRLHENLGNAHTVILDRLHELTKAAMERLPAEEVYQIIASFDSGQYRLYWAAKEILGIDPIAYFKQKTIWGVLKNLMEQSF